MAELVGRLVRSLEVPLRAFCCKARGGGDRLRHATGRMKKENVRWVLAVIIAKAVAVASVCLNGCGLVRSLYLTILGILRILTIIPDWWKVDCKFYRFRMVR